MRISDWSSDVCSSDLGSGTSGGILAPVLILGGALGYIAGLFLPGGAGFWALMGMAAIMSGAMRAPTTCALFAAELTGHFTALPHTMAAAATASGVPVLPMSRSTLTAKIHRDGRHTVPQFSVTPMQLL